MPSCVVLARKHEGIEESIGRTPATEMKQSGIEVEALRDIPEKCIKRILF